MAGQNDPPETTPNPDPLRHVIAILHDLATDLPALEVGVHGSATDEDGIVDREKGVAISYAPANGIAEARLWLSGRRAKLTTCSNGRADAWMEITDRFVVSLGPRPALAGHSFRSDDAFVHGLLRLMRRRVTDAIVVARDLEAGARPDDRVSTPAPGSRQPARRPAALTATAG